MRPSPPSPLSHRTPFPRERGSSEAGYNLVMLMVLLTILSIVLAASLPAWSNVIRRDREEELIFRGLQYAEAIRVFQNRFQRPPIRLEELVEVEPRSIRKLWKDPMTESGKWALIPLQGPTAPLQRQEPADEDEQGRRDEDGDGEPDGQDGEDGEGGFGLPKKADIQVGPFKGVHSRSGKTSIKVFNGKERYDEWHFTIELFLAAATGPGGNPEQQRLPMNMSARWIGRPLPEVLQPRQGTGLPGDDDSGLGPDGGRGGRKGGPGGGPQGPGGDPRRGTGKP